MDILVRQMVEADGEELHQAFKEQGWHKPLALFARYFDEQASKERRVYVAESGGAALGYATLIPRDVSGPYRDLPIPTIVDFNTLIKHQKKGVGTAIMDVIEDDVRVYSDTICLGVGLHSGYGAAQRMYVKRGYVPDGSGVWYRGVILAQYAGCENDDDLVLYLSKRLR